MDVFFMTNYTNSELGRKMKEYIRDNIEREVRYEEYPDMIYVRCKHFSISIDLEEEFRLDSIIEAYDVAVNREINIEVLSSEYEVGVSKLAHLFSKMLLEEKGDFLVLDDCSKKIIWRTQKLFVASKYTYFPFNELQMPYTEV